MRNGLLRSRNVNLHVVVHKERIQKPVIKLVEGLVVAHTDLLTDDAHFLFHRLGGKIGLGHKFQKHGKIFVIAVGSGEEIRGHFRRGESVTACTKGGKMCEGVAAVLILKQLMLQKMGDTVGYGEKICIPIGLKYAMHRAVTGSKQGKRLFVCLGYDNHLKTRGVLSAIILFLQAQVFRCKKSHHFSSFPVKV